MTYTKKDLGKNSFEFEVVIPKKDITSKYDIELEKALFDVTVEGFRKGKAPKNIAEKQIDKQKLYELVINDMLPKIVSDIVKKENLKPIVNPQIRLTEAKENEDWKISVLIAERPIITLPDYKKIAIDAKNQHKKDDIWVPGKDETVDKQKQSEQKNILLNTILNGLLTQSTLEIPDFIIESEVNRRLSDLIDEVKRLGMTLSQYIESKKTTEAQLRENIKKEIEETYKLEMLLDEIADKEQITVTKEDTDKLLVTITDMDKRKEAEQNLYYYSIILRRQKLIDFLSSL